MPLSLNLIKRCRHWQAAFEEYAEAHLEDTQSDTQDSLFFRNMESIKTKKIFYNMEKVSDQTIRDLFWIKGIRLWIIQ